MKLISVLVLCFLSITMVSVYVSAQEAAGKPDKFMLEFYNMTEISQADSSDALRGYYCLCHSTGEYTCEFTKRPSSCEGSFSCEPASPGQCKGQELPKILSYAMVRKIDGDAPGCDVQKYDVSTRTVFQNGDKRMQPFTLSHSSAEDSKVGCEVSFALIETNDNTYPNVRKFYEYDLKWEPLDETSKGICGGQQQQRIAVNVMSRKDTKVDPETLIFTSPIGIRPGVGGAGCRLSVSQVVPTNDPPGPHPPFIRVSFMLGMGGERASCDINYPGLGPNDPLPDYYVQTPFLPEWRELTFKRPTQNASCSVRMPFWF